MSVFKRAFEEKIRELERNGDLDPLYVAERLEEYEIRAHRWIYKSGILSVRGYINERKQIKFLEFHARLPYGNLDNVIQMQDILGVCRRHDCTPRYIPDPPRLVISKRNFVLMELQADADYKTNNYVHTKLQMGGDDDTIDNLLLCIFKIDLTKLRKHCKVVGKSS